MYRPIWVYWETERNKNEPAYITLCRWSMLHHWSKENLIFLNKGNIDSYVPGITYLTKGMHADIKGRLDRFFRRIKANNRDLAIRCDVYRANILKFYGGIYCDASTVALRSLSPYFQSIEDGGKFLVSQRQSFDKTHFPVSFYGCMPNTEIINSYVESINRSIKKRKEFSYNEIGAISLTQTISSTKSSLHILEEKDIMPITFERADDLYLRKDICVADYIGEQQCVFKLFNNPFNTTLRNLSINELYYSDFFIGSLFRFALPEKDFKRYYDEYNRCR